jgi:hypothetical protein
VELVGTNTLASTAEISTVINVSHSVSNPDLTIEGNGKLIGTCHHRGLYADGDLTINGGTIAVTSACQSIMSGWGNVIINGGDIIAETTLSGNCIRADYDLTINGGNVTAISVDYAFGFDSVTIAKDLNIQVSTTADGELGEPTKNISFYSKVVITGKPTIINNVNVSATFSSTPADATTSTTGATVTATKWYRKSGSSWTELGASDTIKEGNTYRCKVTVGTTAGYKLADGYTVKINGTAATNQSGNTWYRDVTITGYTSYVDVYDIALPEAGAKPDFTFNDVECRYSSVALVEWFECDKDGKKLSGALSADYKFKEDAYYRLEVTVVPDANYKFDTRDLDFYIGGKAAQYYYPYQNTTYPDSVTGWKVYHVDDANGTYTVKIGDITLKDGDYLANNAASVTTVKPVGGYAYYKDGVLTLNNFVAAKLVRYYERYLEVELIGENKIGAIADYYYWDTSSNNYYTALEFRGDGNLDFGDFYDHPYSNVSVNGDVIFNGSGDILLDAEYYCFQYTDNVIINDGYVYCYTAQDSVFGDDTIIEVNGGELQMFDAGCWDKFLCNGTLTIAAGNVYVSDDPHKIEWEDCVPWDGVTDLNTYDNVWIVSEKVSGSGVTVSGTITSYLEDEGDITVQLLSGEEVAYSQTFNTYTEVSATNTEYATEYSITGVVDGTYTLRVSKECHVTRDYTITVSGGVVTQDLKIHLIGDINADGKVNATDKKKIYAHINDSSKALTGYEFQVANVNGDDKVNATDKKKVFAHINGNTLW